MAWKSFASIFLTVLVAEMGDKTQLATLLYSSQNPNDRWMIFAASSLALVISAGIGVLLGAVVQKYLSPKTLQWVAGTGFIVMGIWTLIRQE